MFCFVSVWLCKFIRLKVFGLIMFCWFLFGLCVFVYGWAGDNSVVYTGVVQSVVLLL